MSVTGTGAGSLSITGAGTAFAYPVATGDGRLSISGAATAYAYAAAVGAGTLSITGDGTARAHPAGTGAGTLAISGAGTAAGYAAGTGDGRLSITGAATGGPVVSGVGAGTLSITGDGGDTPRGVGAGSLSLTGNGGGRVQPAVPGIWLHIHTTPPAQIYQRDALRGRMDQAQPRHRVPFEVSATQSQLGSQNDAFSVRLDRPAAALRHRLASQGPYGVQVDVMDGGIVSRSGTVTGVGVDADGVIELDCQGSGWTTDLPLRTNADLGTFRAVSPLPWRYGRAVTGRCVRISQSGTLWLWADHASSRISSVSVGGQVIGGWTWRNDTDAGGNPVTLIQTVDPVDDGAELTATGDGALDPQSGGLLTNPADVVYAICQRAGRSIDRGDLVPFRVECLARSLEVSGSIEGGSLQSVLAGIAESIYAAFGRQLPGLMRLRPRTGAQVTIPARDTPTATASRDGIATRLRVRFALEDGQPRASIEVRAGSVEALRGSTVAEVTLPWVRDARTAADVASRMLADRARPRYVVAAAQQQRRLVPGDVVNASVSALGLSGAALVTAATITERGSRPTLELIAGAAPEVSIMSIATAYSPEQYAGATVTTQGDQRVLTITAPDGRPLAGATCVLNGSNTRTTDSAGRVSWPVSLMPPGVHTIEITAAGYAPMSMQVTV